MHPLTSRFAAAYVAIAFVGAGTRLRAQTSIPLFDRIGAAPGTVAFAFPSRAGVCGDGQSYIRVGRHTVMGNSTEHGYDVSRCVAGPVRVRLTRSAGEVTAVDATVGPTPSDGATDLGMVTAVEGSAYLLDLAERSDRVAERAIAPALLGEGVDAAQRLLAIARTKRGGQGGTRHEPLFWAGQYAAAKLRGGADPFARIDPFGAEVGCDEKDEQRHAVFVLSQLRHEAAVPSLVDVVQHNRDACIRGTALFWLVESGDDRAVDVVASVLAGR